MNFHLLIKGFLLCLTMQAFGKPSQKMDCLSNLQPVYQKGLDYFQRGQYLFSTQSFALVGALSCDSELVDLAKLKWGQALFELDEFDEAMLTLDSIQMPKYKSTANLTKAFYQSDLVKTLPSSEQDRFERWNASLVSLELKQVKKPWLAGSLSAVLPGLGQVYNGNYQSAAMSFVLNALFLSSTMELSNKGLHSTALASGLVFSVLYFGNIIGSYQASQKINETYQQQEALDLKKKYFPEF